MSSGAKSVQSSSTFRFRHTDKIGAIDAQEDRNFLFQCFVDKNDELKLVQDTLEPECILLGRTGAGKTALLSMLRRQEDKVAVLSLDDLALNHLSNSPALKYYLDLGINLDLFFRVLWRHVFAVELVHLFSSISGTTGIDNFYQRLKDATYRKPYQRKGREYLLNFPEFWREPEKRLVQETERLEEDLTAKASTGLQAKILNISGELQYSSNLTQENRAEIERIGNELVNQRQMQELSAVVRLLRDELQYDGQKKYFITVDKLDTRWVEDPLRYKLIRALIETVRILNEEVDQLKIILAIRQDLLERVFENTREYGDQLEKYDSICIRLLWNEQQLTEVVEKRINQLLYNAYARRQQIKLKDLLPPKVDGHNSSSYFIERTLSTPRDAIAFFNRCIEQARGREKFTQTHVKNAERIYSHHRLQALADEWSADYPTLAEAVGILRGVRTYFNIQSIVRRDVEQRLSNYIATTEKTGLRGRCYDLAYEAYADPENSGDALFKLFWIFCRVGILGCQDAYRAEIIWSHSGAEIFPSDVTENTRLHVHPAFYRVLGIRS